MSKPNYTGAKTYFVFIDIIAFAILFVGAGLAGFAYMAGGVLPAAGVGAGSFLIFLALIAVSQIGRATIHTAENTRRMADIMQADLSPQSVGERTSPKPGAENGSRTDQLVARR